MGNTTSDVNDSLKAQADSENGPEIYKLVNVAGGGELARLMKIAVKTKDYTDVDNCIRNDVAKYLYNEGKGETLPIEDFVLKRCGGKLFSTKSKKKKKQDDTVELDDKNRERFKAHCFKLDSVGAVGESLLHLCMLNGTAMFIELAKRLIKHFPAMINDIYLSEDYFGEAALHMAIVNENPSMVRFLLLNGADVHQRCCGKFFVPEDQKSSMDNSLKQINPVLSVGTNYVGYAYFGEYPLSFAAILNQEECIRLLIAKGADPNRQDSNGNTVMHMLVIYNNLKMFELMLTFNPSLQIKNRQGLTPLNLAAKLARGEMFYYILDKLKKIWFTYGDISTGSYPLDTIDSINTADGSIDIHSAVFLVINGESEEHLDLIEGLVIDLLKKKWNSYIKYRFYFEVFVYFCFLIVEMTNVIMKVYYFDDLKESSCSEEVNTYIKLKSACNCAYMYPNDNARYGRFLLDMMIWVYVSVQLVIIISEMVIQRLQLYIKTLLFNPSKIIFIVSLLSWLVIIPMRLTCNPYGEDLLTVLAIVCETVYILYLGRGFKATATFVYIIHLVLKTQFAKFLAIFSIFLISFSQAFYVATGFGQTPSYQAFTTPWNSIFNCLMMALRFMAYEVIKAAEYSVLAKILLVLYMVLVGVILINLLIAMMTHTYNKTTELKREWLRQWAKQVLTLEQNLTRSERLKQQKMYSAQMSNGEKVLMVSWKQTEEERALTKEDKFLFREVLRERFDNESAEYY